MRLRRKPLWLYVLMLAAWLCQQHAAAQGMRDPTIPPFGSGPAQGQGEAGSSVRGLRGPLSIISVDGKFHLVVGTRLFGVGQKVGGATIERISETEVWLREGRELRKVSNFVAVKRRNTQDSAVAPRAACEAGSSGVMVNVPDCESNRP